MSDSKHKHAATESVPVVITRVFNAPRELVWRAWTTPDMVKHWWGPKIFDAPHVEMDFRVGGKFLYCMRATIDDVPDIWKEGLWSTGVYKEIVPLEKIVATDCFADAEGNVVSSEHYGMAGVPLEMLLTITFEDAGEGQTKMTLTHEGLPAGEHSEGANVGWNESFDKLQTLVEAK